MRPTDFVGSVVCGFLERPNTVQLGQFNGCLARPLTHFCGRPSLRTERPGAGVRSVF
jgi:hypothetical protein